LTAVELAENVLVQLEKDYAGKAPLLAITKTHMDGIYQRTNKGFGNFVSAVNSEGRGYGALVTAQAVFDNPAAVGSFELMKRAQLPVFVGAKDVAEEAKLRLLGVHKWATIITVDTDRLKDVIRMIVAKYGVEQVIVYKSVTENLGAVDQGQIIENLAKPNAGQINAFPLAIARGYARVMKGNQAVKKVFTGMAQSVKDKMPAEQWKNLTNLEAELAVIPTIQADTFEQNSQAAYDQAVTTIQETIEKV
jgi:hypothetical protein